ncbi:MAG: hypothetical protein MUP17_03570 [candidate division Zixibacteria bacterium]|nr:hypothetical protein [candidate division Zixibacteria bacterium]
MPSIGLLKNKKILLGSGLILLLIIGFFAFKMLSGGSQPPPEPQTKKTAERPQLRKTKQGQAQAQNTARQTSPADSSVKVAKADSIQKVPGQTPLYELLKNFRDPFGSGNKRVTELEERLKMIKMEIELLRDSLEQEKLKEELTKFKKGSSPAPVIVYKPSTPAQIKSSDKTIIVKAILIAENNRTALLYLSSKKAWVKVGDLFEGWVISEISSVRVVLTRDGKNQVLGYHPVPAYQGGKNE